MAQTSPAELPAVARALHAEAQTRALAADLRRVGVEVLALKGPHLQQRLYGTPVAYPSADVDVLVRKADARTAHRILREAGWRFEPENGVLWRLSRAATFERDGVRVDLHWGLHAAHLPAWTLRRLERFLWDRAAQDPSGLTVPDEESLVVYLALHAAGHGFERVEWRQNVAASAALVTDWDVAWRIAREARVEGAVRAALSGAPAPPAMSLLDGPGGKAVSVLTWTLRGHFLPREARDAARRAVARLRTPPRVTFRGLELEVDPEVFVPQAITETLAQRALDALEGKARPVVVDVGTGAGAVALAVAASRPDARVYATDVTRRSLRCARRNARRLRIPNVRFVRGWLLEPLPDALRGRVDAVCSNVPYVPTELAEGHHGDAAVVGTGPDGLGLLREVAAGARTLLAPGGVLVVQLGDFQWPGFADELRELGYEPHDPDRRRPGRAVVGSAWWPGSLGGAR